MNSAGLAMNAEPIPLIFDHLQSFTREEVELWNWYCSVFPGLQDWKAWSSEVFAQLLKRPAGQELCLIQKHSMLPAAAEKELSFDKEEIQIGREPSCDVFLSPNSISKQHARIFLQEGNYCLEDLGSALGTYKNKRRLPPRQPAVVKDGEQFAIFPYHFTVKLRQTWIPESEVKIFSGKVESMDWNGFLERTSVGSVSFAVFIEPGIGTASLQVSQPFLETILDRLLGPLRSQATPAGMTSSDSGVFEFVLLSVLQRANRQLAFPFQFDLSTVGLTPKFDPQSRGLALAFSLGLSQLVGCFRLFLPYELLAGMRKTVHASTDFGLSPRISWKFRFSAGQVELTPEEMRMLELDDVILFDSNAELLFPTSANQGWTASLIFAETWKFEIGNYFERSLQMDTETSSVGEKNSEGTESFRQLDATPALSSLPVTIHVILGEKELTLAEANGLAPGTILELEKDKADPVDLAINGKLIGKGELVEVERKVGVKILSWRK